MTNSPHFGINIDPAANEMQHAFVRARLADENDLDLITIMDHPYNAKLFDTWTLLTALAMSTEQIHLGTNVLNLPLRSPPTMIAKQAATLDILTGGRVEVGIGAGAVWDGIAAYGGPRRAPGEAYQSVEDALYILRGMWDNAGSSFSYDGEIYRVKGAKPGPAPAHRIPIWVGAYGPRMLHLVGRMADGVLVSRNYAPPERLNEINARIDEGAQEAGRSPDAIRRGYNLMGAISTGQDGTITLKEKYVSGTVQEWVDTLVNWHQEKRLDTFMFWPVAGDHLHQIEVFAREVIPAVKVAIT
jgi:alkanesulfonate monooxygenase SsuD/methylene tetrahydromethanopterin reductase-like flavin-dependent oxidoreductase (luciferase family)